MFFKETIDSYLQITNQRLATLKINKTIINGDTNFCFTTLAFSISLSKALPSTEEWFSCPWQRWRIQEF